MDSDCESSSDEQPLVRSACVPSDVLSALEQDLCGSRSPSLTVAPRNPKAPGRARDVAEVVDERDLQMVPANQVEATVSNPSTQLDASWEDPGPTVEFDLTQLDSSDEELLNMPRPQLFAMVSDKKSSFLSRKGEEVLRRQSVPLLPLDNPIHAPR